jgi:hypothetical protein
MGAEYSVDVCRSLTASFRACGLERPLRRDRYDPGDVVAFEVTPVPARAGGEQSRVRLLIESFVGGGFAGQVYRVRVLDIDGGDIPGLVADRVYALKILVPPGSFSRFFRNFVFWVGFQGPFQLQSNPAAARAGALWQKLIRRAARVRFGTEEVVNDIHATCVDPTLGSCGEISDWVDGRTWHLEVDDRMDLLRRWHRGLPVDSEHLGSPEYRAKKEFMARFVGLLHDVGAHEFARQYEWSTWKSQPNCLKRTATEGDPTTGLVAVDFRAGLALLPFLPMSPGDFRLIAEGIRRGSLVQFDRGDLRRLDAFAAEHAADFVDLAEARAELREAEAIYRDSLPDITHHHVRLFTSARLWSTLLDSAVRGWRVRNLVDDEHERRFRSSRLCTLTFGALGFLPFGGAILRRVWGRADWRAHARRLLTERSYFQRALRGKMAERTIRWHRAGRVDAARAPRVASSLGRYLAHALLAILPVGMHKFLSDGAYARARLHHVFVRPIRLYFDAALREQWLRDMVTEGRQKRIIREEDAATILSQIGEPFIQKYLKSLAVHVCTLPVTQIVSVLLAVLYVWTHPELPRAQAWATGAGIIALFQVIPVSPGSLTRGLYVLYLVIRERNFKDYNIAVFLGFFKYVGYLAFPIQMTYRYPTLARFMAAHWATEAVHAVPVFGEAGALLEHKVFGLFYNWPLTLRRRMRLRAELRARRRPRDWHVPVCALAAVAIFGMVEALFLRTSGALPTLRDIWWLAAALPLACGAIVTLAARGASLPRRLLAAVFCGAGIGLLSTALIAWIAGAGDVGAGDLATRAVWRIFAFAVLSPLGAILTELQLPEPSVPGSAHEHALQGTVNRDPQVVEECVEHGNHE